MTKFGVVSHAGEMLVSGCQSRPLGTCGIAELQRFSEWAPCPYRRSTLQLSYLVFYKFYRKRKIVYKSKSTFYFNDKFYISKCRKLWRNRLWHLFYI